MEIRFFEHTEENVGPEKKTVTTVKIEKSWGIDVKQSFGRPATDADKAEFPAQWGAFLATEEGAKYAPISETSEVSEVQTDSGDQEESGAPSEESSEEPKEE